MAFQDSFFKPRSYTLKSLKVLQSLQEIDHSRYCNKVTEACQCTVTYIMKYTSAFAMITLCVIAALINKSRHSKHRIDNW